MQNTESKIASPKILDGKFEEFADIILVQSIFNFVLLAPTSDQVVIGIMNQVVIDSFWNIHWNHGFVDRLNETRSNRKRLQSREMTLTWNSASSSSNKSGSCSIRLFDSVGSLLRLNNSKTLSMEGLLAALTRSFQLTSLMTL